MIIQNIKVFTFEGRTQKLDKYEHNKNGLVLKFLLNKVANNDCVVAEIPGTLKISFRIGQKDDVNKNSRDRSECLFQVTDKNGFAPILDTELFFTSDEHPEWKKQKLSIPLNLYDVTKQELWIVCNKTHFSIVYEGCVINEDLIYGDLCEPTEENVFINSELVGNIEYSSDINNIKFDITKQTLPGKPICYTPFGHNTFIGDVMNFYHDGIYHMLYMPDRHHHSNRWGCGGHHFEHMITKDFIHWEDVGAVWDVTEQWQTAGTGTMFFHNNKYYITFGLHTSRMKSEEKLISDEIKEFFYKNNKTPIVSYEEIFGNNKFPSGTSYAESNDGINFKCSNKIVHFAENPSVYTKGEKLIMLSGYGGANVWGSNNMDEPWSIIKKDFPPCFEKSNMLNSDECPSYFEWNGYQYLMMGFTGFWRTEKNSDTFFDSAVLGYDIYDGLSVPMAVVTDDNRAVMAGWLGGIGWASAVVHRELVQFEDGTLGSRWLPELMPKTKPIKKISNPIINYTVENPKGEYYIEARIKSENGKFALKFMNDDNTGCELRLDFDRKTAQFSDISKETEMNETILPLYQAIKEIKNKNDCGVGNKLNYKNLHCRGRNFSIAKVNYKKDTGLKIMAYYNPKMDTTVLDVEINGERTMISNRTDLLIKKIKSCSDGNTYCDEFDIYSAEIL